MEDNILKKYLGMTIYLMYYNYGRLKSGQGFEDNYCQKLKAMTEEGYLDKMKDCLNFAINQESYCLELFEPDRPIRKDYSDDEIKDFFDVFYDFLDNCLKK